MIALVRSQKTPKPSTADESPEGFQRHIGWGNSLTSPIKAGSTPTHSSAAR
jgi:hypothetical protein